MNILLRTLQCLKVPHTATYAKKLFEEHPYKDSLYGLSRMLDMYKVTSQGIKVSDKTVLPLLPLPIVAQVSKEFVLVSSITEKSVVYEWRETRLCVDAETFKKRWSGVILTFNPTEESREPDYVAHVKAEWIKYGKYAAVCFLLFVLIYNRVIVSCSSYSIFQFVPLMVSALGLTVCFLLLEQQIHAESRVGQRICTLMKQSSCNSVLDSSASVFFGQISWSEIGFGFFLSYFFLLLLYPNGFSILTVISICALPYTFWSVWYQWRRARQWCMLCLIVQGLLWMLALSMVCASMHDGYCFEWQSAQYVCCTISISVLTVHLAVPFIGGTRREWHWKYAYGHLKANRAVYDTLQAGQAVNPTGTEATTLCFGPKDARHTLTILSNPYCNPCARLHKKLAVFEGKPFRIQFILSSFNSELERTNRYMIAAYQQLGPAKAAEILDAWYAGGKTQFEDFFSPFNLDINTIGVEEEMKRHTRWREQTEIRTTPTILVDDRRLHAEYQVEEIVDIL